MCAICDLRIEFAVDHPLSLSVAIATRQAIDAGLLAVHTARDGSTIDGMELRSEAVTTLRAVQRRIECSLTQEQLMALPDFFMLMIESRVWGFFHPTPDGFDPACRPEPPSVFVDDAADRDAVVLASETAMQQILRGKIPFEQATREGLVVIDADEGRRRRLRPAWNAAYPKLGLGRFALPPPLKVLSSYAIADISDPLG